MLAENMRDTRRFYHTIAETAWMEFQTTINIIKELKRLGYDVKYGKSIHSKDFMMGVPKADVLKKYSDSLSIDADFDVSEIYEGYTGAVATLDTGKPGPTFGLRFDIDANGIEESRAEDLRSNVEGFRSTNDFAMHACGHDAHLTIGLFVSKYLMEHKDELKGKFILIFQPAEEGVKGAKSMMNAGIVDDVDILLAGHVGLNIPTGTVGVGTIGFLATTKLDVHFEGIPAHAGAAPEEGRNAILAAASATLNLHTLTQFSKGMSRLNVGVFQGGTSRNIIADKAYIQIETRGEKEEINEMLKARALQVIEGSAIQYDVKYKVSEAGEAPSLKNPDPEFYDEINEMLKSKGYNTTMKGNIGGSEDVAFFMNAVTDKGGKAIHFLFGSDLNAGHHNDKFDIDEDVMPVAYQVLIDTVEYLLNK